MTTTHNSAKPGDAGIDYYGGANLLDDLIAYPECQEYYLSNGTTLVQNPITGGQAVLSSDALIMLRFCREFKTRDQHCNFLTANMPELRARRGLIEKVLLDAWRNGLLASGSHFLRTLSSVEANEAVQKLPPPVVAIITCERPAALRRLLQSMVANTVVSSSCRIFIIDDSNSDQSRQENQRVVATSHAQSKLPLVYFGQQQQAVLLGALIKILPDCEQQIRFMADREKWRDYHSCGMSRNIALLLSVGRRLILLDDDVLCEAYNAPYFEAGVSFAAAGRESDFFTDHPDWLSPYKRTTDQDPLALHAASLGHSLRAVLAQQTLKPELGILAGARPNLLSQIRPDASVISTACGTLGDPGTVTNSYLLGLSKAGRSRLLGSPEKLESALSERRVWSGRARLHIQARANMSQILGLDNRHLLPPYFPVFRFEDTLFGYMLSYLHPHAPCIDLPWAAAHLPIPERRWAQAGISEGNPNLGVVMFFDDLLAAGSRCSSTNELIRLRSLAQFFFNLSALPADDVLRKYRDGWIARTVQQLTVTRELLAETDATPVRWRQELQRLADSAQAALAKPLPAVQFTGDPDWLAGTELLHYWSASWQQFGDLLLSWSDIRQAAVHVVQRYYD